MPGRYFAREIVHMKFNACLMGALALAVAASVMTRGASAADVP